MIQTKILTCIYKLKVHILSIVRIEDENNKFLLIPVSLMIFQRNPYSIYHHLL